MKILLKYLKQYRGYVALALTIKVIATVVELAIPYILSYILDDIVPLKVVSTIIFWGAVMIICSLASCVFNIISNRMAARVARNTTEKVRHSLFEKILSLSSKQIDGFTIPSLESRLTSDTYHLHHFIGMSMRIGIRAPILLVGGIILTATLDLVLTLILVIVLPLIAISVTIITKKGVPLFKKTQSSVDRMTQIVREDSQGIRVIKALSKTEYERKKFDKANKELINNEQKAGITMAASNPIVTFFLNLGLVSVIVVGAFRVNGGLSETGKIIAFIQYFTMISNAMIALTRIFVRYSKGAASAARIEEVLNTEPDLAVASEEEHPSINTDAHIVFDGVSFSYLGHANNLSNISFSLPHGKTLGVIGATGSGKTTLVQLLMRFYDTDKGGIYIDGRDVRTIPHEELNTMFGVVMQNDFIFSGSIEENIKFGREMSDSDMELGAELAQAKEFISEYDDTYSHKLQSKGTNISGGQKQRILIARALAGKPRILVLDDSSSALDYKTDSKLRKGIREHMTNTTTIVVAQRVSSIMNADLILVLEEGCIIGKGSHEELLRSCPVYKEISDSQIGGAILD